MAEIAYPATLERCGDDALEPQFKLLTLRLASWFYHYDQIAFAVMFAATAVT